VRSKLRAMKAVPFTQPFIAGTELARMREAIEDGGLAGGGRFTKLCEGWLAQRAGAERALLAHSGTGALEAAAMLAGLAAGDEAIMPSFGYPTMASAVVRQSATPVFVDIDPATLNVDPRAVDAAVGPRTRAIVAVHYGGVACAMDELLEISTRAGLLLIEDAAHCLLASYKGRPLGGIGDLGSLSFHQTKNVTCGEGGALLVNDPALVERAEVIWEKGTDRSRFMRGEVDRYTWIDVGSSFGASELTAAFLFAQLEVAERVTARRRAIWQRYHDAFAHAEAQGLLRRPTVPDGHEHNGHLYYVVLPSPSARDAFIGELRQAGIGAAFHYQPLHDSPAGVRFGRTSGELTHTQQLSQRVVRVPLFADLDEDSVDRVVEASCAAAGRAAHAPA
jgi:dTDP-4-amino-4,6-dideoxygalactose transaminase